MKKNNIRYFGNEAAGYFNVIKVISFYHRILVLSVILVLLGCTKDEMDMDNDMDVIVDPSASLPFVSIDAGYSHSLGVRTDGTLWGFGDNFYGQLDDGTIPVLTPKKIGADYSMIAAGGSKDWYCFSGCHHYGVSVGIKSNGSLWSWGSDFFGPPNGSPFLEEIGSGFVQIHASKSGDGAYSGHFLAIKTDSSLYSWGYNGSGQVGDGTNDNKFEPIEIGSDFIAVSAGGNHSLALKAGGSLWAWGSNWYGQLGNGTHDGKNIPVKIGNGFVAIAPGGDHSLALMANGNLVAWGRNNFGQLGNGTNVDKVKPVLIGSGFSAISAGEFHSLALKTDGTLWAWGYNLDGQLGDSTLINSTSPVQVGTGFSFISAGKDFSLALKEDGTLWAWGKNDFGQLGDGTKQKRLTPVLIGPR